VPWPPRLNFDICSAASGDTYMTTFRPDELQRALEERVDAVDRQRPGHVLLERDDELDEPAAEADRLARRGPVF
jgi:hypothetical protein